MKRCLRKCSSFQVCMIFPSCFFLFWDVHNPPVTFTHFHPTSFTCIHLHSHAFHISSNTLHILSLPSRLSMNPFAVTLPLPIQDLQQTWSKLESNNSPDRATEHTTIVRSVLAHRWKSSVNAGMMSLRFVLL